MGLKLLTRVSWLEDRTGARDVSRLSDAELARLADSGAYNLRLLSDAELTSLACGIMTPEIEAALERAKR